MDTTSYAKYSAVIGSDNKHLLTRIATVELTDDNPDFYMYSTVDLEYAGCSISGAKGHSLKIYAPK